MQRRVGQDWTVAIALAHLAFWDRRVLYVLDMTERDGKLFAAEVDIFVNDLSSPLWAAIPPARRPSTRSKLRRHSTLGLENFPPELLSEIYTYNKRWVLRALPRGEHG